MKTYLITGASDGIGLATARLAAKQGTQVVMLARDEQKLRAAAASIEGPLAPEIIPIDLTDARALDRLLADFDANGWVPDVLVNNAGHGASGAFVDADWAKLDAMLNLNVRALARLAHWAARGMQARGSGNIVNLSAAVATRPTPYFSAYAASKAFVTNLSIALSAELRGSGVSVTAIHPPAVRTGFADAAKADLRSTLVLKLFPTVGAETVAKAVLKAVKSRRRSIVVGPVAGIVMGTAHVMPPSLDLAFMTLLFKGRRSKGSTSTSPVRLVTADSSVG